MQYVKAFLSLAVTIVLIWLLQTKFGDIPPVGKLLNPVSGFWQNAEKKGEIAKVELNLPGLHGEVTILFDKHRIPHIFAKNDHDAYYAQGYLTARDRLWQMDIQTRSASGRLAEIVGEKALEADRNKRRMGMVYGAENTLKGMMRDKEVWDGIVAYTEGINAYIAQLSPKDYPLEFKLLDYKPEKWKPINSAYLLKLMSQTLAGGSDQFAMTNTLNKFGPDVIKELFPDRPAHDEPIIPKGTKWNFTPLEIPKPSKSFTALMTSHKTQQKREGIGSNNWAVSGRKSASGYPILANDPHLDLTYPSIWHQVQLATPTMNVYGVALPGAPGVVIGFNKKISWGVTNVDAAVLDWYQIKFKDKSKTEYWYNNRWNKIKRRVEIIKVRGKNPVYDTVLYTHHGPVVYESADKKKRGAPENVPVGKALRWVAHDVSDEFKTFYLLNRANNYADYRDALKYYSAPAQNFIFADVAGNIAITPNGKIPIKYKEQGKFIMDGSDPGNDWHGFIPQEQNPTVKNPTRGFVSSANQFSTDATYPYYINWQFAEYERGKRINDRLAVMTNATVDSMRILQTDDYSIIAQDVLPAMLQYVDETKLTDGQISAYKIIKGWNKHFSADAVGATIFTTWWKKFFNLTWNNRFYSKKKLLRMPSRDKTEELLLKQPNSKWFDDPHTDGVENASDRVNKAFIEAVDELIKAHGNPGNAWRWGRIKQFEVAHLAGLDGMGSGNFESGGTGSTVNALIDGHGPSWRMVVQTGPQMKGYGILPGGESGNPGSFYYDDMFATWKAGRLDELLFLQSEKEGKGRIKGKLVLNKLK
ncbi:penicillin acylase family protein [Mucilaginibacter limnophilus]|uniref:Penicillin acylase family protein n=1 Tax=Mucilaginibacter limnophilus TaxID=1932778 RepID=A0A437MFX7_9SPHI|nr:penicillin acylase family protein [Mucilaginibacter limnophilus]RVT96563.1 penicillin acylase family protein [Mucilaginibacter limnophilus]